VAHECSTTNHKIKKELSICQSLLCLDLVSFPVLSQIKPQAPVEARMTGAIERIKAQVKSKSNGTERFSIRFDLITKPTPV